MKRKIMYFFFYFQIRFCIRYKMKDECENFYLPGYEIHVCVNGKSQK